jgi:ribosomal protein S18 acetylase RimI-like enzyme
MIAYGTANNDNDLRQILDLQARNLPQNISTSEAKSQGFVTAHHNLSLLKKMNVPYPHIVAKDGNKTIGYALVMQRSFATEIPVLTPMFEQINSLSFDGKKLGESKYFVMGQVCIEKGYRGQGVFKNLYAEMQKRMSPYFDYIITEVAMRNTRSMRAHEKAGFEVIHQYTASEDWAIILLRTRI